MHIYIIELGKSQPGLALGLQLAALHEDLDQDLLSKGFML